ncbi:hypothetical protein [Pseudomonas turukhanskensis]|uniref:Uncharacterized protein n=1 Tax=Pseudomonas turukhanskensis TaxID=1806536 RepID=A0A9W6NGF3_9PSED|nr:hypothetical protein [Pseudomonas turukhanskensis]GLK89770.1 hypothetical protein GCM10017655_28320 [Pseudomonas turukhanskensis]
MAHSSFTYEQFLESNSGMRKNGFDYLQLVSKATSLPADFFRYLAILFSPEFVMRDEKIYLLETFDDQAYAEYKQSGMPDAELQFWMNLVEITGVFDVLGTDDALHFAGTLAKAWNLKLTSEFGEGVEKARVIHDEDTGEVFVTIGLHKAAK